MRKLSTLTRLSYNSGMTTLIGLQKLGMIIKTARESRGWTQTDLKNRTGISIQYLSGIENAYEHPKNGLSVPSDDKLIALSRELNIPLVTFQVLLGRIPELEPLVNDREVLDSALKLVTMSPVSRRMVREMIESAYRTEKEEQAA